MDTSEIQKETETNKEFVDRMKKWMNLKFRINDSLLRGNEDLGLKLRSGMRSQKRKLNSFRSGDDRSSSLNYKQGSFSMTPKFRHSKSLNLPKIPLAKLRMKKNLLKKSNSQKSYKIKHSRNLVQKVVAITDYLTKKNRKRSQLKKKGLDSDLFDDLYKIDDKIFKMENFQCGSSISFKNYKIPFLKYLFIIEFLTMNLKRIESLIFEFCFSQKEPLFWVKLKNLKFQKLRFLCIRNNNLDDEFLNMLEVFVKTGKNWLELDTLYFAFLRIRDRKKAKKFLTILQSSDLKLRTLLLDKCNFCSTRQKMLIQAIPNMEHLENFHLVDTTLDEHDVPVIKNLWQNSNLRYINLEKLSIYSPDLLVSSLGAIGRMDNLRFISLRHSDLHFNSVRPLVKMFVFQRGPNLKSLDLSKNLFDVTQVFNSEFRDCMFKVDSLTNFCNEFFYLRHYWDESIYVSHYLDSVKSTLFNEKLSKEI